MKYDRLNLAVVWLVPDLVGLLFMTPFFLKLFHKIFSFSQKLDHCLLLVPWYLKHKNMIVYWYLL